MNEIKLIFFDNVPGLSRLKKIILGKDETGVGRPPMIVLIPTNNRKGLNLSSSCLQITTVKEPKRIIADRLSKNIDTKNVNPPKDIINFLGSPFVNLTIDREMKSKNPAPRVIATIILTEKIIKMASTLIV